MNLIKQPKGTGNCGQCVVAMLSKTTLESAILIMGEGRTSIPSLQNGLFSLGIFTKDPIEIKSEKDLPTTESGAILIDIKNLNNQSFKHWIAWDGKHIYDPKFGRRDTLNRISSESVEKAIYFSIYHIYK